MLPRYKSCWFTFPKMTTTIIIFVNVGSRKFQKLAKLVKALTLSSCTKWSAFCCQRLHFKCSSATLLCIFYTFIVRLKCSSLVAAEIVILGSGKVSPVYHSYLIFLFCVGHIQVDNNDSLGCAHLFPSGRGRKSTARPWEYFAWKW